MMKRIITRVIILAITLSSTISFAQDYTFDDFVGTWSGFISSNTFEGYNDPITMIIEPDGFYTETSGHLMPTIYPNTQESDFDDETNRYHWWYLKLVYSGQYFYQHFFYEVVYFNNDTLEMHYNFWDDPEPNPEVGKIFLVRANAVGTEEITIKNLDKDLIRVVDILGRDKSPKTKGEILIYHYSDGTIEKRFIR